MAGATFTYDPTKIAEHGKDQMRFELGDIMTDVDGQAAALSDEEINAVLTANPGRWKRAKLALVESVMRRFSFEVDEKVGPLTVSLRQRYENWKAMHDQLAKEISSCTVPSANPVAISGDHYFTEGMHNNPDAGGTEPRKRGGRNVW